jgi:hypothetical protein
MTAASTAAAPPHHKSARLVGAIASHPLAVALAVTALVTALRLTGTVDSDVAWQLWIAQRIHAGARLYRDIIEVNPPLWFWMALPVERLASLLSVRAEAVLIPAMGALTALSLAATDRLLGHIAPPRRALLLGYAALTLMALPWVHLGQREQIVLIGTMPYAALIAARREGRAVPIALAALVGSGAAVGFALKHYFLVVPALFELWLLAGRGRGWQLRRPEIAGIVGVGAAYATALLLLAPDFLTRVVPLARLSYGMLGAPSLAALFGPFALIGLVTLCVATTQAVPVSRQDSRFGSAMLIAGIGFAIVYFIQAKGWIYHAIPLLGCASLALAAFMIEQRQPRAVLRIAGPALLLMPFILTAEEQQHPILPSPDLKAAVAGLQRGDTVGFLAVETAVPWSITLQNGFRYPSRYMGYWMLNAVVADERNPKPDPRLAYLGRQVVSETVADFACIPPRRIVVARPRPGDPGFDILAFFQRDPQFNQLLSHYRVRSRTSFETFELASPWPRVAVSHCRPGA